MDLKPGSEPKSLEIKKDNGGHKKTENLEFGRRSFVGLSGLRAVLHPLAQVGIARLLYRKDSLRAAETRPWL